MDHIIRKQNKLPSFIHRFHGHEKTHVNLFFISKLMDRKRSEVIIKMEVVIKKKKIVIVRLEMR